MQIFKGNFMFQNIYIYGYAEAKTAIIIHNHLFKSTELFLRNIFAVITFLCIKYLIFYYYFNHISFPV